MGFQGSLPIGAKDIDRLEGFVVYILDEFLNWFRENLALRAGERALIRWESLYSLGSLCLLELAARQLAVV
jgi:hypothetical protein